MPSQAAYDRVQKLINTEIKNNPNGMSQDVVNRIARQAAGAGLSPADIANIAGVDETLVRNALGTVPGMQDARINEFGPGQRSHVIDTSDKGPPPPIQSTGSNDHIVRTVAEAPSYLQPFLNESANFSLGSLYALGDLLSRPNALVAPFNDNQLEAMNMAKKTALGEDGVLPTATGAISEIAKGDSIAPTAQLGKNLLVDPTGKQGLLAQSQTSPVNGAATNTLTDMAQNPATFGSPGFQAAVDASIRQAKPHIMSQFSQGGAGAVSGGLAKIGMQQAASDAFARLYDSERNRQYGAANSLGGLSLSGAGLQQNALNSLMGADQNAGGIMSSLANSERGRQMQAAGMLPQMGLLGSDILSRIGGQQQQQTQNQRRGAIDQHQQLLGYSFGNINPTSLIGQSQTSPMYDNKGAGILGGALGGAGIANMLGLSTPWGVGLAGLGGLLGSM